MTAATASPTLPIVRQKVRELLLESEGFKAMPADDRARVANDMVRVGEALAGGTTGAVPQTATVLADTATEDLVNAGGTAADIGVGALGRAVQQVNFPQFVAGLIDGVFNAIVTASIKQMEAYAELLKNVAKTVDEYMKDNVSENQARDYLVEKYPDHLELDMGGGQPQVRPRQGADEDSLPDFFKDLGLTSSVPSLDDETPEQVLVPAARRRMALDRQQLLATMVLMGINRLVVKQGTIQAGVIFDLDTTDAVNRSQSVATQFEQHDRSRPGFFGWFAPRYTQSSSEFKVQTATTEGSEAEINLKTKLTGNVNVVFGTESFPLDRMGDIIQPQEIAAKAPAAAGATPAPAA
jgi:hypothetical protein